MGSAIRVTGVQWVPKKRSVLDGILWRGRVLDEDISEMRAIWRVQNLQRESPDQFTIFLVPDTIEEFDRGKRATRHCPLKMKLS